MKTLILTILISILLAGTAQAAITWNCDDDGYCTGYDDLIPVRVRKPDPDKSCCQQWEDYLRPTYTLEARYPPECRRKFRTKIKMVDYTIRIIPASSGVSRIQGTPERTLEESVNLALEKNEGWELSHFNHYGWYGWGGPDTHRIWLKTQVCVEED